MQDENKLGNYFTRRPNCLTAASTVLWSATSQGNWRVRWWVLWTNLDSISLKYGNQKQSYLLFPSVQVKKPECNFRRHTDVHLSPVFTNTQMSDSLGKKLCPTLCSLHLSICTSRVLGNFSNKNGKVNENDKKTIGKKIGKVTTPHVYHAFLYISLAITSWLLPVCENT